MSERIRWEPLLGGNFDGYVGTVTSPMFEVHLTSGRGAIQPWALRSDLLEGYSTATHPDELKAEAERWLEEFVSSLGAVFPAEPDQPAALRLIEARSMLARWDAERGSKPVIERVLADQVRALLAIVDPEPAPEADAQRAMQTGSSGRV